MRARGGHIFITEINVIILYRDNISNIPKKVNYETLKFQKNAILIMVYRWCPILYNLENENGTPPPSTYSFFFDV